MEQIDINDLLVEYCTNNRRYYEDNLVVRDHNTASLLSFRLNFGQDILESVAEKQKAETGRVRILLLKSRRFGGSTWVQGRFYKQTSMNENMNAFIVAHEEESTRTLFNMAKLFHEKNPLQPATISSNAQELIFDNKKGTGLKSGYRLATAKNTEAGRSQGIHFLHESEEAFYPKNAPTLQLGLFQCVPDPPSYSEIIRESTANGYGNTFQIDVFKTYNDGKNPYYERDGKIYAWSNPKTDWVLVFIPWFAIEKYRMDIPEHDLEPFKLRIEEKVYDEDNMEWIDSEPKRLLEKYNLSLEQLYWREWAIENKCGGSLDNFHMEYPSDVFEAFLSRGSNFFARHVCDELEAQISEPIKIGKLDKVAGKTRVTRNKHGNFIVWETCNNNDSYYLTVDVAGGLSPEEAKKEREPDKTNIDVWNHRTGNQAAQWNGHIDYDLVADLVMMIGDLYSTRVGNRFDLPIAAVELNNQGHAVVGMLEKDRYPQYKNETNKLGWQTNKRNKGSMVTNLRSCLRDSTLKINSKSTINEMRTYIEEGEKYFAATGCNDDRVITAAIAASIINSIPKKYSKSSGQSGFTNLDKPTYESSYREYYVN